MKLNLFLTASAFAVFSLIGSANAYVVCNRDGDCWHTDRRDEPPGVSFQIHPDDWYFHRHWDHDRDRWHDYREGRGYWRNGVWITL
jgi:hypothetical protein